MFKEEQMMSLQQKYRDSRDYECKSDKNFRIAVENGTDINKNSNNIGIESHENDNANIMKENTLLHTIRM